MTLQHDAASLWLQIERNLGGLPFHRLGVQASRDATMVAFLPPGPAMHRVVDRVVTGAGGSVPVRIYQPVRRTGAPAVLYAHGGGWSIGSLDGADGICRTLAARTGFTVVSVDYRQAPEHPYPAPLDDVWTALTWLAGEDCELAVDPERIAVAGDSAGGNLAAATALRARSEDGPRIAAQLLVYPALDDAADLPSYRTFAEAPLLTTRDVRWFWRLYLGEAADSEATYARPGAAARLEGLAPTAVLTAEQDPVRDDGEQFARRLARAGVPTWTKRYEGVYHGFFAFPGLLSAADEALRDAADYLMSVLTPEASADQQRRRPAVPHRSEHRHAH